MPNPDNAPSQGDLEDNVVTLHNPDGTFTPVGGREIGAAGRETARKDAARRKAVELHRVQGAKLRSSLLPRMLTRGFAEGTVNLMFAKILQNEVEPKSAKEAAEVAKIADDIARRHGGEKIKDENRPKERDELLQTVRDLAPELQRRAQEAAQASAQALGGAVPDDEPIDEVDLSDFDFGVEDEVPATDENGGYAPDS